MKKYLLILSHLLFLYYLGFAQTDIQNPRDESIPYYLLGDPRLTVFNINNFSYWLGDDNFSGRNPFTSGPGVLYPRFTANIVSALRVGRNQIAFFVDQPQPGFTFPDVAIDFDGTAIDFDHEVFWGKIDVSLEINGEMFIVRGDDTARSISFDFDTLADADHHVEPVDRAFRLAFIVSHLFVFATKFPQ